MSSDLVDRSIARSLEEQMASSIWKVNKHVGSFPDDVELLRVLGIPQLTETDLFE